MNVSQMFAECQTCGSSDGEGCSIILNFKLWIKYLLMQNRLAA